MRGLEHLLHLLIESVMLYYYGGQRGSLTKDEDIGALGRLWVAHVFRSVYGPAATARALNL